MRRHLIVGLVTACSSARPAPTSAAVWGTPEKTMVLGLEANGETVTAFLKNRGAQPQRVIAKGVQLKLERAGWVVEVFDHSGPTHLDRDESFVAIPPGDQLAIPIDLGTRARQIVGTGGGRAIDPGTYTVTASYNATTAAAGAWWSGVLEAGPVTVQIR